MNCSEKKFQLCLFETALLSYRTQRAMTTSKVSKLDIIYLFYKIVQHPQILFREQNKFLLNSERSLKSLLAETKYTMSNLLPTIFSQIFYNNCKIFVKKEKNYSFLKPNAQLLCRPNLYNDQNNITTYHNVPGRYVHISFCHLKNFLRWLAYSL